VKLSKSVLRNLIKEEIRALRKDLKSDEAAVIEEQAATDKELDRLGRDGVTQARIKRLERVATRLITWAKSGPGSSGDVGDLLVWSMVAERMLNMD
jgi:hypothetical protein